MSDEALAARGDVALTPSELSRLGRAVPRRLRFTRQGKLLFTVALLVGFGAVNSGNNLLYLVLGVLLSLILISGVLSELTLRKVTAIRRAPPHLFAGEPALIRIDIVNHKRWFTSFSVEVRELSAATDGVSAGGLEQRRGFLLSLPPGETAPVHLRVMAARRGIVATAGIRVTTRFPFGFFEKSRIIPLPARYVVFPTVRPLEVPSMTPLVAGVDEQMARVGQGDEFYALRDARLADDARTIAWKVTARRDKLIVREHQRPAARRVQVVVANVLPASLARAEGRTDAEADLEAAISEAASLATALSDAGYAVGVESADGALSPDSGRDHLVRIYEHLARLPVRVVPAGLDLPRSADRPRTNVERVGFITPAQQAAALTLDADRAIVVDAGGGAAVAPSGDEERAA